MNAGFNLDILGDGSTSWCNQPQRSRRAEELLLPKPFLTQPKDKCFSSFSKVQQGCGLMLPNSIRVCCPPSCGQEKACGDLDIVTQMLELTAVNLAKEINTRVAWHGLLLPKGGGGRTGRAVGEKQMSH